VTTDGSLTGLGDFLNGRPAQGVWEGRHLLNINCLEMKSVFLSPRYFLLDLRVYNMLVWTDNMSVVSYINHQGGLHSHTLFRLVQQIQRAVSIPGHSNMGAIIWPRQRLHPKVEVQQSGSGCFRLRRVDPLYLLVPPHTSMSVHFPPDHQAWMWFLDLISLLEDSTWRLRWYFTPSPRCGSCWSGPWGVRSWGFVL